MAHEKLTVAAQGDREVVLTRAFNAPRALVFDCITKPELVKRWMLGPPGWTMPVCEIDLRVGGRYRYVWRNAEGQEMGMGGVYREIAAPERIVSAELFDEDWTGGETLAKSELSEEGGRTILTTTVAYANETARQGALVSGMAEGMEMGYARLDGLLVEV
ncbi:SRPBCC family protein [Caulobacter sp. LARHSG274]